jgi:S1-C subfamily serine protease
MGFDEGGPEDDESAFRPPLPPEDRLWRHPSEVGAEAGLTGAGETEVPDAPGKSSRTWAVALVSGLVGALLATGLAIAAGRVDKPREKVVVEREAPARLAVGNVRDGVVEVTERARPAIVQLLVDRSSGQASGSGVIFQSDGHVLTNAHVVSGSKTATVILSDGRNLEGRVVGTDADTDIAVVKVDGGPFSTASLGSATKLRAGEECIAIGSPLGLAGGPSVSVGVVSALGRSLDTEGDKHLYDMIQTDAAISPGSSGGALLDKSGTVIGITTAIAVSDAGAEGLGFATPIDIARSVAQELMTTGKATHVWLGIEGADIDTATAKKLDVAGGAAVKRVVADGPADKAGMAAGDVITMVDGRRVTTMASLIVALRSRKLGEVVSVTYLRDGEHRTVRVPLQLRPAN